MELKRRHEELASEVQTLGQQSKKAENQHQAKVNSLAEEIRHYKVVNSLAEEIRHYIACSACTVSLGTLLLEERSSETVASGSNYNESPLRDTHIIV